MKEKIIDFFSKKRERDLKDEKATRPAGEISGVEADVLDTIIHMPPGPEKDELIKKYRKLKDQEKESE